MRFLSIIISLILWVSIILLTAVEEIPSDGYNLYGYPKRFVEMYNNEFTGKLVVTWNYWGMTLNILLLVLIYLVLNAFRKKIFIKKVVK